MKEIESTKNCNATNCIIGKYCNDPVKLLKNKQIRIDKYDSNQNIFIEGSRVFGIYVVKKGKVKVYNSSLHGKKQIIRLVSQGSIISLGSVNEKYFGVSSATLENSEICFIYNDTYQELINNNPDLMAEMLKLYAIELRSLEIRQKHLSQLSIKERIAEALLLVYRNSSSYNKSEKTPEISVARIDLANIAGCTVEAAIRTLSEFAKEDIILKKGRKIRILQLDKLYDMLLVNCCENNYDRERCLPYL